MPAAQDCSQRFSSPSRVGNIELVKVDPFAWFKDVLGPHRRPSGQAACELLPHRWPETAK
jgi:hypothetical protein